VLVGLEDLPFKSRADDPRNDPLNEVVHSANTIDKRRSDLPQP
jgi:hypothetical protein